ncbi:MAG: DeoR family transcriptional regulator, partial [Oscillospiraceae bacterium]
MIDNRKMLILSAIVDEYIKTGEPIGSNLVLRLLDINISSATVRNDMAFLEKAGLLEQTHTSSGRIPTYDGYRYYIDNIMRPKRLSQKEKIMIDDLLIKGDTADAIIENAVDVMSELTNLAVVSKSNVPVFSIISKVEVIPAGRRLYALLIITSSGTIKNKICRMEFDLTNEQLEFFKQFASENLTGLNVDMLTPAMLQNLAVALG